MMKKTLKNGPGSYNSNVNLLMGKVESAGRHKAILTLAKKMNVSYEDAQAYQAKKIAESRLNKK